MAREGNAHAFTTGISDLSGLFCAIHESSYIAKANFATDAKRSPPAKLITGGFGGALPCFGALKCEESLPLEFQNHKRKILSGLRLSNLEENMAAVNPRGHAFLHQWSYVDVLDLELVPDRKAPCGVLTNGAREKRDRRMTMRARELELEGLASQFGECQLESPKRHDSRKGIAFPIGGCQVMPLVTAF